MSYTKEGAVVRATLMQAALDLRKAVFDGEKLKDRLQEVRALIEGIVDGKPFDKATVAEIRSQSKVDLGTLLNQLDESITKVSSLTAEQKNALADMLDAIKVAIQDVLAA